MAALLLLGGGSVIGYIRMAERNRDRVSWYVADMDGDAREELLVVTGGAPGQRLETGEAYGKYVEVYSDYRIVGKWPVAFGEPDYRFDLSDMKPLKVQAGDIDGDGVTELAVCVYKEAKFHPVGATRPFFYDIVEGRLAPIWLGSRLARPFDDYVLADVDQDGICEIVSIEMARSGRKLFAAYDWKGFGFEVKGISDEMDGEIAFSPQRHSGEGDVWVHAEGKKCKLQWDGGKLTAVRE